VAVLLVIAAILYPVFARGRNGHPRNQALSNLKQLALGALFYSTDHDERLPMAETWMDVLVPYTKNIEFHDPSIKDRKPDEHGFAFFEPLSGVDTRTVLDPDKVPLMFQSVLMGRNAHSDLSTLPAVPRERDRNHVAFVDGHVKGFPPTWPTSPITITIGPTNDEGGEKE
jgi:prepilin-type processing-associated H-X9-DG protein